jgi:ubiquinone/menaquinone biosynthesis C-methylase UbiE
MNHAELNRQKWDARSATYDDRKFSYFRFFQKRALALLELSPGQRFLDVGCGTGWAVRYAAGLVGPDGETCGVDLSPGMIERARERSRGLDNVRFEQADAAALPFEDDRFDAVLCTNSFHHYPAPAAVLAEIKRVLRPGGALCVLDPTADGPIVRALDRRMKRREPEHVTFYSSRDFRALFEAAGLAWQRSRTVVPLMKAHLARKSPDLSH